MELVREPRTLLRTTESASEASPAAQADRNDARDGAGQAPAGCRSAYVKVSDVLSKAVSLALWRCGCWACVWRSIEGGCEIPQTLYLEHFQPYCLRCYRNQ